MKAFLFALLMLFPVMSFAQQVPENTTCSQYSYLAWDAPSNLEGAEGFNIYQSGSPITQKTTPIAKVLLKDFQDPLATKIVSLPDGPTYFRVTMFGGELESDLSNEVGCMYTKVVGVDLWRIVTANNDKVSEGPTFLTFKINVDATVFVMYDSRVPQKPGWLSDYVQTREVMNTSDGVAYQVYMKEVTAGTVTLGGNTSAGLYSMYGVAVLAKSPDSRITEAKTLTKQYLVVPFEEGGLMYADRAFTIAKAPNLLQPGLKLGMPLNLQIKE